MNEKLLDKLQLLNVPGTNSFEDFAAQAGDMLDSLPDNSTRRKLIEDAISNITQAYVDRVLPDFSLEPQPTWSQKIKNRWKYAGKRTWQAACAATEHVHIVGTVSVNGGPAQVYGCTEARLVYSPVSGALKLIAGVGARMNCLPPQVVDSFSQRIRARIGGRISYGRMWFRSSGIWQAPKQVLLAMPGAYVGTRLTSVPGIDAVGTRVFGVWNPARKSIVDLYLGLGANTQQSGALPPSLQNRGFNMPFIRSILRTLKLPEGFGVWSGGDLMVVHKKEHRL